MPVEVSTRKSSEMTLSATLSDVTGLANLLKSVAIQTHAVVIASSSGLEIVTELNRTLQAHAYLYSHMFDSYHFEPPTTASSLRPDPPTKRSAKRAKTTNQSIQDAGSQSSSDELEAEGSQHPNLLRNLQDSGSNSPPIRGLEDEPAGVSFEINLQTWISCLNIFGGVGPSRPHGGNAIHSSSRSDNAVFGGSSGGRGYGRSRDGSADPYGADRAGSVERGYPQSAAKATSMRLSYQGHGHPLVLELEQEVNVLTRCSISTYEPSFLTDMVFDPHDMVAQVIVGSELMQSAFSEIDASCKKLSIYMKGPRSTAIDDHREPDESTRDTSDPDQPKAASMLRFKAISDSGSSEMEFPASLSSSDPTGVIEKFVVLPGSSEQWYDFTLLSRTMTVLRSSIKTSIRMDEAGLISFQFMMPKYRKPSAVGANGRAQSNAAAQATLEDEQDAFCEFLVG